MSVSKYETEMAQMDNQGLLNPYAHMFSNQAVEEQPTILFTIMTQLSLKSGLKQSGNKPG